MESSEPQIKVDAPVFDRSDPELSPDSAASICLLSLSADGLSFRSESSFEIGCQIQMGLHVRVRDPIGSHGAYPPQPNHGHFLEVTGFVVDSQMVTSRGRRLFEITLLFDSLTAEERDLLSRVPAEDIAQRASEGELDYEKFLFGGQAKRSGVVGLN